jgi:hypothetical protein
VALALIESAAGEGGWVIVTSFLLLYPTIVAFVDVREQVAHFGLGQLRCSPWSVMSLKVLRSFDPKITKVYYVGTKKRTWLDFPLVLDPRY